MANIQLEEQAPQQEHDQDEQYDEFGQFEEGNGLPHEVHAQLPPVVDYGHGAEENENDIGGLDYNQDAGPVEQEQRNQVPQWMQERNYQQRDQQNQQGDQNDLR